MPSLIIKHNGFFALPMPYVIAINDNNVCVMRSRKFQIHNIPAGTYEITVKCGYFTKKREYTLSGTTQITLGADDLTITFTNSERIWNILFDIDLILWLIAFFITLPSPWHFIYKIVSNGFFVIWIIRLWIIRKRYFKFGL